MKYNANEGKVMALLVSGSRHWTDDKAIRKRLETYKGYGMVFLLHGGCRGADTIAASIGGMFGYIPHRYPAFRGGLDGPGRNRLMFNLLKVFDHSGYSTSAEIFLKSTSKGTAGMLRMVSDYGFNFTVTHG